MPSKPHKPLKPSASIAPRAGGLMEAFERLLSAYPLCDSCFGRQFAILSHGIANDARGRAAKLALVMEGHRRVIEGERRRGLSLLRVLATKGMNREARQTLERMGYKTRAQPEECCLCAGVLEKVEELKAPILEALKPYTFETFLIGVRVPREVVEREDALRSHVKVRFGESIRSEFARRIGKLMAGALGKRVDHRNPDVMVLVNPFSKEVEANVNPVYVKGRYRKLKEGIPQTSRTCSACGGKGCPQCLGTGKHRPDSLEALIAREFLRVTGGEGESFHVASREGTHALATGKGVPFVLEIRRPRNRFPDLSALERDVNVADKGVVEIHDLSFTSKDEVRRMKQGWRIRETYKVLTEADGDVEAGALLEVVEALRNSEVRVRALGGRQDAKVLRVYDLKAKRLDSRTFDLEIVCQGGLDVKAFVAGKDGTTEPTLARSLGRDLKCLRIDLVDVAMG